MAIKYDSEYPKRVAQRCRERGDRSSPAVMLKFGSIRLEATNFRDGESNYRLVKMVLIALIGYNPFVEINGRTYFEESGGTIEFFRSF